MARALAFLPSAYFGSYFHVSSHLMPMILLSSGTLPSNCLKHSAAMKFLTSVDLASENLLASSSESFRSCTSTCFFFIWLTTNASGFASNLFHPLVLSGISISRV